MIKEAILLAGGMGTRLQKVVSDVPKPLAPVAGKPFIVYVLDELIASGIEKFIFSVGYKYDSFISYFGDKYKGCAVEYVVEQTPLGTGGGIKKAMAKIHSDDVIIINADTIFKINIAEFYDQHKRKKADLSIVLKKVNNVSRYGSVMVNKTNRIISFSEKNTLTGKGFINGGIYFFKNDFFTSLNLPEKFSLEKDCLGKFNLKLKLYGFPSDAYFLDIGIPEDYKRAQNELA
jgi:D-glycero-alpha-D-manno-heptose 1-phosphate guanylyltransferase